MANSSPYKDRRTSLIEVVDVSGVKLKVYGICTDGTEISNEVVATACEFVEGNVEFGSDAKYAFAILHHGEEAMWLLVDWWIEDILHQQLYFAPLTDVFSFQVGPPNHELACVWELPIIAHERDAWVKHTMIDPENADFTAYLADTLTVG